MAEIIILNGRRKFPVIPSHAPEAGQAPPELTSLCFTATISLRGGKNVVCSIAYPHGRIARRLVAIMLRQAAKMVEGENV